MAMSKQEQSEAAKRIMAKIGPMTPEEQATYDLLSKNPEDYRVPGQVRTCGVCGTEFRDAVDEKGVVVEPALEKFSDHMAFHNPSPAQWAEAHKRIEASKPKKTA